MTLQAKCTALSESLSKLEQARQQQTLADSLNKRADELDDVLSPFVNATSAASTLLEGRIIVDSRLPDSGKASERVTAMRQQLATEPQGITTGQAFNLLCRAIKSLTEQCDKVATESWKEHVKTTAPVVHKNTLSQFRDSPGHADIVFQIERLKGDLRSLERKPPSSTDTLNDIVLKWNELSDCVSKLPVSEDPEVQAFLNAATSSDGAQIGLLTQAVIDWLEEKKMLADFCIRRSK